MLLRREKKQNSPIGGREKIRAHVLISGRVQGVLFRLNTKKEADELGISGWVRNLADGRVEAVFEGDKGNVEQMVDWARRGPIWAKIDDFSVIWEDYSGEFTAFGIRYI